MLEPTPQQREIIERIATEPSCAALLAAGLGTGKTLMAVEVMKALGARTVLLLAPKNTFGSWQATIESQGVGLEWRVLDAKHADNWDRLRAGEAGVYAIGHEFYTTSGTAVKPRLKEDGTWTKGRERRWDWSKVVPDLIVVDEAHKGVANRWSAKLKVLGAQRARFKLMMSATPQGSKFDGIWAPTRWLWPEVVDRSKQRWEAVWCATEFDPHTFTHRKVVGEKTPGAYLKSLPCAITWEREKVPYKEAVVRVELSPVQRKMWDEMAEKSLSWMRENNTPLVASLPVVQRVRLRQMALGEVSLGEDGSVSFADDCASSKIRAVEWVRERHHGANILVFTDSARFAKVAAKRLGGVAWTGETPPEERQRILDDPNFGVLVATFAAVAEGSDGLQRWCNVEVILNPSDSAVLNEQASGRLNRTGQKADVIYRYTVVAKNTLDDDHFTRAAAEMMARKEELR